MADLVQNTQQNQTQARPGGLGMDTSTEKLDRIRDIVFGSQIREYTQRFTVINNDLSRLQQQITDLSEQVSQQEKLQTSRLREQDERLSEQLQEQQRQFSKQIQDLNLQLTQGLQTAEEQRAQSLQSVEKRLNHELQKLDDKQTAGFQELQKLLRQMQQEMRNEIRQTADHLSYNKTDRFTMGDLLIQMGNNLKDGSSQDVMMDLIEQLGDPTLTETLR